MYYDEEILTPVEKTQRYLSEELKKDHLTVEERKAIEETLSYLQRKVSNRLTDWQRFVKEVIAEIDKINSELEDENIKYSYSLHDKTFHYISLSVTADIEGKPTYGYGFMDITVLSEVFSVDSMSENYSFHHISDVKRQFLKDLYSSELQETIKSIKRHVLNEE